MPETKAIAILGASDATLWTYWLIRNLAERNYPGEIWLVNPNRTELYETKCYPSIDALPGIPETAFLITNPARTVKACADLIELGTREIVIISDGFGETATPEGIAAEKAIAELGKTPGVRIFGPNCVGFASLHDSVYAIGFPMPEGIAAGNVSLVSHSGMVVHATLSEMQREGLGIDICYTIGNGVSFNLEAGLASVSSRKTTTVSCAIIESVRDRDALHRAILDGQANGQELVFLLLGQTEDGKRVAQSHTGAVLGDQRIMRAWLQDLGVILVDSIAELVRVASLLNSVGRPGPGRGVFFLSESGGATGIAADACGRYGLPLAELSPETAAELKKHLLPGTTVGNPLDTTTRGGPESTRAIYDLIAADPSVGILVSPAAMAWPDDSDGRRWNRRHMGELVAAATRAGLPLLSSSLMVQEPSAYMRRFVEEGNNLSTNVGLVTTISALAKMYRYDPAAGQPAHRASAAPKTAGNVVDEAEARLILSALGLPLVKGVRVTTPEAAAEQAAGLEPPWVAKVAVPGLGHKGSVGGVRLGLCAPEALRAACQDIEAKVTGLGVASADQIGFMIQEMVFGPELLVGLVRDRVAGPSLIVGVGGWAAESSTLFAVMTLPASREEILRQLGKGILPRLIGPEATTEFAALLAGLGDQFADGALSHYREAEFNPVIITGRGPRIADVLLISEQGN